MARWVQQAFTIEQCQQCQKEREALEKSELSHRTILTSSFIDNNKHNTHITHINSVFASFKCLIFTFIVTDCSFFLVGFLSNNYYCFCRNWSTSKKEKKKVAAIHKMQRKSHQTIIRDIRCNFPFKLKTDLTHEKMRSYPFSVCLYKGK